MKQYIILKLISNKEKSVKTGNITSTKVKQ